MKDPIPQDFEESNSSRFWILLKYINDPILQDLECSNSLSNWCTIWDTILYDFERLPICIYIC